MIRFGINLLIKEQGSHLLQEGKEPSSASFGSLEQILKELHSNLKMLFANPKLKTALAADHNSPAPLLSWLAQDSCLELRLGLARNPASPPDVLIELARQDLYHLALAANPSTPAILLAALALSWNPELRKAVAANPNTPPQILAKLAIDTDIWVRIGVASNERCPQPTLHMLANPKDLSICRALARNPCTPLEVLTELTKLNDGVIQIGLECHPKQAELGKWTKTDQPKLLKERAKLPIHKMLVRSSSAWETQSYG